MLSNNRLDWTAEQTDSEDREEDEEQPENEEVHFDLSRFSTRRICSREQRKKQLDWLATDTDDITTQHIRFLLVRANKFAKWKTDFSPLL